MNGKDRVFSRTVEKPWGREVIFTASDRPYTGKLLFINAGARLSLQYHEIKEETLCLLSGRAWIWLEDENGELRKQEMKPQHGYTALRGRKHRLEAIEDALVIEASDPEKGTTVRVEDDYERSDETEDDRSTARA
jgi:mannose-6-phosphate isomerase-like protein (cupin superfamily)